MMEPSDKRRLLDAYWEGLSSTEDDLRLNQELTPDDKDQSYFELLEEFRSIKLSNGFEDRLISSLPRQQERKIKRSWLRMAAAVAVVVGVGLTYLRHNYPLVSDGLTSEERKQLELTKEALLLMSTKMNEGLNFTYALGEFDEAMNTFTNN